MTIKVSLRTLALLLSLASLAACTTVQGPTVAPADTTATDTTSTTGTTGTTGAPETVTTDEIPAVVNTPVEPPPPSTNPAVIALLDTASNDATSGRLPTAIASVERALRIEPKNPVLWQKLAKLKLEKGDYQQAENFAARSNSWAGANKALMARNWRIISEARSLRGDNQGAKAALERAKALEE